MIHEKIAVVGNIDSVSVFRAAGADAFGAENKAEAEAVIKNISKKGYAVIFITDDLAEAVEGALNKYKTSAYPAIIPIPSASGSTGAGMRKVYENADKVTGSELLFKIK